VALFVMFIKNATADEVDRASEKLMAVAVDEL